MSLRGNNSGAKSARELSKPFKDLASLPVSNEKNFFGFGFFVSHIMMVMHSSGKSDNGCYGVESYALCNVTMDYRRERFVMEIKSNLYQHRQQGGNTGTHGP